jgi:hypothetical protein
MIIYFSVLAVVFGPIILITYLRKLARSLQRRPPPLPPPLPQHRLKSSEQWVEPSNSVGKFWKN